MRHGHTETYKDVCTFSYTLSRDGGAHIWYVIYTHIFVHFYMVREGEEGEVLCSFPSLRRGVAERKNS